MSAVHKLITDHLDIWTAADTEKKSGRGRASGNANSVYGIKKLRELILELAVRGKLVPQDQNDEPASDLFKRIQAEKANLVANGTKKNGSHLTKITSEELPHRLPHGWEWVRNNTLFNLRKGKIPKNLSETNIGLPYLDIDALDRGLVRRYTDDTKCPQSTVHDLLVVCDGSRSGLVLDGKFGVVGSTLSVIDSPTIIQPYIKLLFQQGYERRNSTMKGAAIPHLDTKNLLLEVIGLPPLPEQNRIVAKVDELMSLCDQLETQHNNAAGAHEQLVSHLLSTLTQSQDAEDFNANWQRIATHFDTLFTTESSIDALKQTLLQLAVMGKLVPQDPNDEPASELLKRIQAEKAKLVAEGKIKKDKPLASISESEKPFNLPSNWAWTRLQNAIDVRDGTHDSPKEAQGSDTFPLVTSKDFNQGEINFESARRISAQDHFEISKRSLVEKHDILFSMIGGNIGNQAMVLDDRPFSIKNVALFKYYDPNLTDPFFVKKYLENLAQTLQATAVGGAQPFVALGALRNLIFAMPPIEEQHRIVTRVDKLMILCEQLKSRITGSKQCQQKLADILLVGAID